VKFSEIANRLTGMSTPLGGVSWRSSDLEVSAARRVIAFLEDRRVLYAPNELEVPSHRVHSVLEIRHVISSELGKLDTKSEFAATTRILRHTKVKKYRAFVMLATLLISSACGGGSGRTSASSQAGPAASITATSGTPQSAIVNTPFVAPLVATIRDANGNPVGGVQVAFVPPGSGASGTFGTQASIITTNASGVATSGILTANGTAGSYAVSATVDGTTISTSFNLTNTAAPPGSITATGGSSQTALVSTAFPLLFTVQVVNIQGTPASGVTVTFNAPAAGASGTFVNGIDTATTDSSGIATSARFIANGTAGSYSVTAAVAGVQTPATFDLTNLPSASVAGNYVFLLSGLESATYGTNSYALAGAVTLDANGNIVNGEQDYKDDWHAASPQPSGDKIIGGSLNVNGTTGLGTLTLVTENAVLGTAGTETIGVQFVNAKHALAIQFDGSATSSGTMDWQTLPGTLDGSYSFTLLGTDTNDFSTAEGGVFSLTGSSLTNGLYDYSNLGVGGTGVGSVAPVVSLGNAFSGTVSSPDSFGRGTITVTSADLPSTVNYYVVTPEVLRLVVVGPSFSSGAGSAYSQGASAGTFSDASLGTSVFGLVSNANGEAYLYAATGMLNTVPNSGSFSGVGDLDEEGAVISGGTISGTYKIAANGYGTMNISGVDLGDVTTVGLYLIDPQVNLLDPNDTASDLGGALIADIDPLVNGAGFLLPQTDTATSSFAGHYAFGVHEYSALGQAGWELDLLGEGPVTSGILNGKGILSDPSLFFGGPATTYSGVNFTATTVPDSNHAGRYTLSGNGFVVGLGATPDSKYKTVAVYQASGEHLLIMDEDLFTLFLGIFEQQTSLSGIPGSSHLSAMAVPTRSSEQNNLQPRQDRSAVWHHRGYRTPNPSAP
jgi:hypothetical protein